MICHPHGATAAYMTHEAPQFFKAGFEIWHTGGNCTAWGKNYADKLTHILITGEDACFWRDMNDTASTYLVHLIDDDDNADYCLWPVLCDTPTAAIMAADLIAKTDGQAALDSLTGTYSERCDALGLHHIDATENLHAQQYARQRNDEEAKTIEDRIAFLTGFIEQWEAAACFVDDQRRQAGDRARRWPAPPTPRPAQTMIDKAHALLTLCDELCDSVDAEVEDVGGHRGSLVILKQIGPATLALAKAMKRFPASDEVGEEGKESNDDT